MPSGQTSTKAEGGACILVGLAAIAMPFIFAIGLPVLIGLCFVTAGLVWIWRGWRQPAGTRSLVSLILAAVMVIGGAILIVDPETGTLAIGLVFLAQGIVTLAMALSHRGEAGLAFVLAIASGTAGIVFGIAILTLSPFAQEWVLPLLLGIDLILLGLSLLLTPASGLPAEAAR